MMTRDCWTAVNMRSTRRERFLLMHTYLHTGLGELLRWFPPELSPGNFPPQWSPPDLESLLEWMKRLVFSKPLTRRLTPGEITGGKSPGGVHLLRVHTYIHAYILTYMHTHMHTNIVYTSSCICMYIGMHISVYACKFACTYGCMYVQTVHTYIHTYALRCMYDICRQTYMHTYIQLGMYRLTIRYSVSAEYLTIRYYPDPVK